MEKKEPIFMSKLNNLKLASKIKTILITVIITVITLILLYLSYIGLNVILTTNTNTNKTPSNSQVVTLKNVIIAYSPETKSIIFLNRSTGQVEFSLSDSVSMAIFALKSSEIVKDYSSSLTNKK